MAGLSSDGRGIGGKRFVAAGADVFAADRALRDLVGEAEGTFAVNAAIDVVAESGGTVGGFQPVAPGAHPGGAVAGGDVGVKDAGDGQGVFAVADQDGRIDEQVAEVRQIVGGEPSAVGVDGGRGDEQGADIDIV